MPGATDADRKRQVQEVTIFHDVAKALTSMLDLDSILQTIMLSTSAPTPGRC